MRASRGEAEKRRRGVDRSHHCRGPPLAGVAEAKSTPEDPAAAVACHPRRRPQSPSPVVEAWRFWREGAVLKLVDETLGDNYSREDVMKCIHIGLLCIQESVARRPNMTFVVASLGGQSISLPLPSPPNFFDGSDPTSTMNTGSSGVGLGQGVSTRDTWEITELDGR